MDEKERRENQNLKENPLKTSNEEINLETTSKHMTKAIFFNFLMSYGSIPINLILTMIISRIISEDAWGQLIYATVIATAPQIILNFIPPSSQQIIIYQFPEMLINKKKARIKGILNYFFKVKITLSLGITLFYAIFSIILWYRTKDLFYILLLFVSPQILYIATNAIFRDFYIAHKQYNFQPQFFFIGKLITLSFYIILALIPLNADVKLSILAIVVTLEWFYAIPFYYYHYRKDYRNIEPEKVSWQDIKSLTKFGLYYSVSNASWLLYKQFYTAFLNIYGIPSYNTYDHICNNISSKAYSGISVSNAPVLSDLESTHQREKMLRLFKITINFVTFLVCIIIGLLHFLSELYITIIYPSEYRIIIPIVEIYIFSAFFITLQANYKELISVTKNQRSFMAISLIENAIFTVLAFFGMYFFSFEGIIYSRLIGWASAVVLFWFFGRYIIKEFKLSILLLFKNFIALIVIVLILVPVIFPYFEYVILDFLNAEIIIQWASGVLNNLFDFDTIYVIEIGVEFILQAFLFLMFFLAYLIMFRVITKEDISRFENLGFKIPLKNFLFRILKKILRHEK
ncbi:MAG: hypothetical protein GF364_20770 [Candidatus Lokiarchaeota archaeon]|nr:hypothetical protein [Candidatus Lokiarchaeota archaeon]